MRKELMQKLFPSTDLHEAVAEGDVERVRRLLDAGADVNAHAFLDATPLMQACVHEGGILRSLTRTATEESSEEAKKLLEPGNPPRLNIKEALAMRDRPREYDDAPPTDDDPAMVRLLLEHGADVNAVDHSGQTAMMKAATARRVETMRVLLEYGADRGRQTMKTRLRSC